MKAPVILIPLLMSFSLQSCGELFPSETTVPQTQEIQLPTVPTTGPATVEATIPLRTGWVEEDGNRYYYDDNGIPTVGWMEMDGKTYYFYEDGTMATGEVVIEKSTYHFTSQGWRIVLVNPWNYVPADYQLDLVNLGSEYAAGGGQVQRCCYEDLVAMITDCNKACPQVKVVSAYRSHDLQTRNYNNRVQLYVNQGYSLEEAKRQTGMVIAVPGTSEHELGLAVDIIDTRIWDLVEEQANLPAQQWLMEHSWEYGFILRYPKDKTDKTGIIYEPWHYRYVGKELAAELHSLDLTLEEYMESLTDAVG